MSTQSHIIILPRREENLIAIVRCDCRGSINEVMNKIVTAVTNWVKDTVEGAEAWTFSSEDFNIADLSSELCHPESRKVIAPFLTEQGVYNLEIDIFGDSDAPANYNYDTVLVEGL